MIVFTNHLHQYAAKDEKDPKKHLYSIASDDTYVPNVKALSNLHHAVTLYGNIPNKFPEAKQYRLNELDHVVRALDGGRLGMCVRGWVTKALNA